MSITKRSIFVATLLALAPVGTVAAQGTQGVGGQCCTDELDNHSPWASGNDTSDATILGDLAQSFTPSSTYVLCRVRAVIQNAFPGTTTATMHIKDGPNATDNTIVSKTIGGVGAENWYSFDIPDIVVTAGTTYYIVFVFPESDILWRRNHPGADGYVPGQAWRGGIAIDTQVAGFTDWWFECFTYEECANIPTMGEWGLIVLGVLLVCAATYVLLRRGPATMTAA